jgi:hypothetical protein
MNGFISPGAVGMAIRGQRGRREIFPIVGAELVVNGSFETGNPPTGWLSSDATLASVADPAPGGGSKSLSATRGTNNLLAYRSFSAATGQWLQITGYRRSVSGTNTFWRVASTPSGSDMFNGAATTASSWSSELAVVRATAATLYVSCFNASGESRFDLISVKPVSLSTCFVRVQYAPVDCSINVQIAALTNKTQAGCVARLDSATNPRNFVVAYMDGTNVRVDECVNGVYTNLVSVAKTFTANDHLLLTLTGSAWTCTHVTAGGTSTAIGNGTTNVTTGTLVSKFRTCAQNIFGALSVTEMSIIVSAPTQYRVFQRSSVTGDIAIAGTVSASSPQDVEASFNGGAYATIASGVAGAFTGTLSAQAQGQGTLTVRLKSYPAIAASVATVGIGDVFVIAGQSNAVGQGTNHQSYSHATLKAALFGNDYLWHELTDPTDSNTNQVDSVSSDVTLGGSCWPLVATAHMANQNVPVAFVPCAKDGSVIGDWGPRTDHDDRATLYGSLHHRVGVTGAKAILMWNGEGNAIGSATQAYFYTNLKNFSDTALAELGTKTIAAKIHDLSQMSPPADNTAVNAAIEQAVADNDSVLAGPDMSDLVPSESLHLHFTTDAEMSTLATRWWNAIKTAFSW